jgi:hypothetical protein
MRWQKVATKCCQPPRRPPSQRVCKAIPQREISPAGEQSSTRDSQTRFAERLLSLRRVTKYPLSHDVPLAGLERQKKKKSLLDRDALYSILLRRKRKNTSGDFCVLFRSYSLTRIVCTVGSHNELGKLQLRK